jgi:DNA-binding NarL/FixJ family response regulator
VIAVLLFDDDAFLRAGLTSVDAADDLRVVATAGDGRETVARVVVLTSSADGDRVLDALDAGPAGRIDPPVPPARRVAPAPELTRREREVLALVALGLANKQVARRLGIREGTVKAHVTSVFHRIGVRDRTSAALWARSHLGPR